jgi:hypothetical protein
MNSIIERIVLTAILCMTLAISSARGADVAIDPERFSEKSWGLIDRTRQSWVDRKVVGAKTFDLTAGQYSIVLGFDTMLNFSVDSSGFVVVENGISAQGGANKLTFITSEVNFEPGDYKGRTWLTWGSFINGAHSKFLPIGLSYRIYPGAVSHSLNFVLEADGSVSTQKINSFDVVGNSLFYKTVPVSLDPGGYEASTTILGSSGQPGIQQKHLVPGATYRLVLAADWIDFLVSETGLISVANEAAVTVENSTQTMFYNNVEITFEPNQYVGASGLQYGGPKIIGPHKRMLVQGVKYNLGPGSTTFVTLTLDAEGNANTNNEIAFTTTGRTVSYNNTDIVIDVDGYTGNYSLYGAGAFQTFSGPRTISLVPNLDYYFNISASRHKFSIDENSALVAPSTISWYQVSQNMLQLNTSAVTIDVPASYTRDWSIGGHVRQGTNTITLVEASSYFAYSAGRGVFDLLSPCAFSPETFSVNSTTSFTGSCGTPVVDIDLDGIPDTGDNCPLIVNPDQLDLDDDSEGDACDSDLDGDLIANELDNCPAVANTEQADDDNDAIGNPCDDDDDNDSVNDSYDNCPNLANSDQADGDADGLGNACDADDDNDLFDDAYDNCPAVANTDQSDIDSDGFGDACDNDTDGDLVENEFDQCPATPIGLNITNEGCSGLQYINESCVAGNFSNHGQFVKCVSHVSKELVTKGVITGQERARFVKEAAKK